jgi:hypothetical protein
VRRALVAVLMLLGASGCGADAALAAFCANNPGVCPDAGSADTGAPDAGPLDAGPPDAGEVDAGLTDAGEVDAGASDAGVLDAGGADAGELDAGLPDAGQADSGFDAGVIDAGTPDAGQPDAGFDAGVVDAGAPDAGQPDAGFDAGVVDAGVVDAGAPDAGQPDAGFDAGAVDAGAPDAGQPDAGPSADAGQWPSVDAGAPTADGGWHAANSGLEGAAVNAFAYDPRNEARLFAATNGGLFTSDTGGNLWTAAPELSNLDVLSVVVAPSNPDIVFACAAIPTGTFYTSGITLFVSKDAGHTWLAHAGPSGTGVPTAFAVAPDDPAHVVVGFSGGLISGTTTATSNTVRWSPLAASVAPLSLWVSRAPAQILALTANGLYRSDQGGAFQLEPNGPGAFSTQAFFAGFAFNPDAGLPYVFRGDYTSTDGIYEPHPQADGGLGWQTLPLPATNKPTPAGLVVAPNGALYVADVFFVTTTPDRGQTWNRLGSVPRLSPQLYVNTLMYLPGTNVVWCGTPGTILDTFARWNDGPWAYTNGWSRRNTGLCTNTATHVVTDPTDPTYAYVVGEFPNSGGTVMFQTATHGQTWFPLAPPTGAFQSSLAVDPFDGLHLLATDYTHTLWSSTSAGPPWLTETSVGPVLSFAFDPSWPGVRELTLSRADGGVVVQRGDGGIAGVLALDGTTVQSIALPRRGSAAGDVAVSTSTGVWSLTDGGVTPRFTAHAACGSLAAATTELIACVTGGTLERSASRGAVWAVDSAAPALTGVTVDEGDQTSLWALSSGSGPWFSAGPGSWEQRVAGLPSSGAFGVVGLSQCAADPTSIYLGLSKRGVYVTTSAGR